MTGHFAAIAGLSLAGIDLLTTLAALHALATGASLRRLLAFTGVLVALPAAMAGGLALLLKSTPALLALPRVDWYAPWGAVLELGLVLALAWMAWSRRHGPAATAPAPGAPRSAAKLMGLAVALSLGELADPTFLGVVALSSRHAASWIWAAAAAYVLISRLPLLALVACVALVGPESTMAHVGRLRARFGPHLHIGVTVLAALMALLLAADLAVYGFTGGKAYLLQ